jgi:hypothetical protein
MITKDVDHGAGQEDCNPHFRGGWTRPYSLRGRQTRVTTNWHSSLTMAKTTWTASSPVLASTHRNLACQWRSSIFGADRRTLMLGIHHTDIELRPVLRKSMDTLEDMTRSVLSGGHDRSTARGRRHQGPGSSQQNLRTYLSRAGQRALVSPSLAVYSTVPLSGRTTGHPGAAGAVRYADPNHRLSVAFTINGVGRRRMYHDIDCSVTWCSLTCTPWAELPPITELSLAEKSDFSIIITWT